MSSTHKYWIERFIDGDWCPIPFASSDSIKYCHGYADAMDSLNPSHLYRICKKCSAATFEVVRKGGGR